MLSEPVSESIRVIALETPFAVGTVNTYLIDDGPLTLIDCGPNTASALDALEAGLAEAGHDLADLETIVVTHQHLDHVGLAGSLRRRSDAELICLDRLAPVLADASNHSRRADEDAYALMLRHGVEAHVAEALRAVAKITRGYGAPAQADRVLSAGDVLEVGERHFDVLHRPGHSPTDTVFHEPSTGLALLGDHLLARVSPNALVQGRDDRDAVRSEPLLEYRSSLAATRRLDITLGLAGHGPTITQARSLIDDRLAAQDRRAERLHQLLTQGPRDAHGIAIALWGSVAVTQAFLTLSEVLGHLGLLIAQGRVLEDRSAEVITFAATGD